MSRQEDFFNEATKQIRHSYVFQNDETYSDDGVRNIATSLAEYGYQYARENLWYDAQGSIVPEYNREVIVIGRDGKVFFGHRPDPKEVTMVEGKPYHAKTYDKNGWNWPNIALWLDVEVPEELVDKITTEYFKEQSSQKEIQNKKKWYSKSFNKIEAVCEFLNKYNLKSEDFKFSDCGVGTPYTILYFSDRYLC